MQRKIMVPEIWENNWRRFYIERFHRREMLNAASKVVVQSVSDLSKNTSVSQTLKVLKPAINVVYEGWMLFDRDYAGAFMASVHAAMNFRKIRNAA